MAQDFDFIARNPAGKPRYLVVLLHGYGRNALMMEKLADEISALVPDALIIMPHAPEPCDVPENDDGNMLKVPQIIRNDGDDAGDRRQWFSVHGDRNDIYKKVVATVGRLNAFIDNKRDMLGITDGQIAIAGFSQGGSLALYTALMRARPVAAAAIHSAPFYGAPHQSSRPPVFYLYGTADEEFSQKIYEESLARLAACANDLESKTIPGLNHRTSAESRKEVARYIRDRLAP